MVVLNPARVIKAKKVISLRVIANYIHPTRLVDQSVISDPDALAGWVMSGTKAHRAEAYWFQLPVLVNKCEEYSERLVRLGMALLHGRGPTLGARQPGSAMQPR
jgi:hypothetical protein